MTPTEGVKTIAESLQGHQRFAHSAEYHIKKTLVANIQVTLMSVVELGMLAGSLRDSNLMRRDLPSLGLRTLAAAESSFALGLEAHAPALSAVRLRAICNNTKKAIRAEQFVGPLDYRTLAPFSHPP